MTWDAYKFGTSYSNSYILTPCIPNYAAPIYEICHCSNHDSNSGSYYICADGFDGLINMIEIMNEQQMKFANKMWEYDLSHETNLRFSSPRLDVGWCDDGASFPHVESILEELLYP